MGYRIYSLAACLVSSVVLANPTQALTWVFNPATGNEYAITETATTWEVAQEVALDLGAQLVTINNEEEQHWLEEAFGTSSYLWIGLTDKFTEGDFVWINGDPVTYTNWAPGEPNNLNEEDYTAMNWWIVVGTWNDFQWFDQWHGILERSQASQIPEPATILMLSTGLLVLVGTKTTDKRLSNKTTTPKQSLSSG